jgi:cobalt-zinc-cadmium efflux system outer membrane protein
VTGEEMEARRQALARSSPLLRTGLAALDREMGMVEVARSARWPDLDVSWLQASEIDKKSWSLSFGVRVPLFNGGRAEVARAEASASLARAVLERTRIEVSLAFESAVQEAEAASDSLRLLQTTLVPTARKTWDLVRLSYEAGETSLLDLLDAQRTLREAEIEELTAGLDLGRAWVEIERIGGRYAVAGEKR